MEKLAYTFYNICDIASAALVVLKFLLHERVYDFMVNTVHISYFKLLEVVEEISCNRIDCCNGVFGNCKTFFEVFGKTLVKWMKLVFVSAFSRVLVLKGTGFVVVFQHPQNPQNKSLFNIVKFRTAVDYGTYLIEDHLLDVFIVNRLSTIIVVAFDHGACFFVVADGLFRSVIPTEIKYCRNSF